MIMVVRRIGVHLCLLTLFLRNDVLLVVHLSMQRCSDLDLLDDLRGELPLNRDGI